MIERKKKKNRVAKRSPETQNQDPLWGSGFLGPSHSQPKEIAEHVGLVLARSQITHPNFWYDPGTIRKEKFYPSMSSSFVLSVLVGCLGCFRRNLPPDYLIAEIWKMKPNRARDKDSRVRRKYALPHRIKEKNPFFFKNKLYIYIYIYTCL
jgi:hypothetical protein